MRMYSLSRALGVALPALAFALAGCAEGGGNPNDPDGPGGPGGPGGSNPPAMSAAETREVSAAFVDEADVAIDALTQGGSFAFVGIGSSLFFGADRPTASPPIITCLTISPLPPEDPDRDGVPTLLTLAFDPSPCTFTSPRGHQISFTGSVAISDPVPNTPGYDLDEVLTEFGHSFTSADGQRARTMVRNGNRSVRQGTNTLTGTEDLTVQHTRSSGQDAVNATITTDWEVVFTGDEAVSFRERLPSGNITIGGTWAIDNSARGTRSFRVETVAPLRYDATCTSDRPWRRIASGEIRKHLVENGTDRGYIRILFTACGVAPTREFVPAPST